MGLTICMWTGSLAVAAVVVCVRDQYRKEKVGMMPRGKVVMRIVVEELEPYVSKHQCGLVGFDSGKHLFEASLRMMFFVMAQNFWLHEIGLLALALLWQLLSMMELMMLALMMTRKLRLCWYSLLAVSRAS